MSNKITIAFAWGGPTVQARLRSWGDVPGLLYFRSRRWNGHVFPDEEGITWLRGWNHDKKTRDALVVAAALGRV